MKNRKWIAKALRALKVLAMFIALFIGLYLVLPMCIVRFSQVDFVQRLILGEPANHLALSIFGNERTETIQSLWGSITVPVLSIILSVYVFLHQRRMERETLKQSRKEWLERYFGVNGEAQMNITDDFCEEIVKLDEIDKLNEHSISVEGGARGFIFPSPMRLSTDTTVAIESVVIKININQSSYEATYSPRSKEERMLDKQMKFALFSSEQTYTKIDTFRSSASLEQQLIVIVNVKVEDDYNCYWSTIEYILKKRSNKRIKNGSHVEIYIDDMICTTK